MPTISKALIIDEPWISYLLQGKKSWELRSRQTQYRGWFGLIRKGSGEVVGIARLADVSDYLDDHALETSFDKHRVGADTYTAPGYKWRYAWKLEDIRILPEPVAYQHKSGAVTWVTLNPEAQILLKLGCGKLEANWELGDATPQKHQEVSAGYLLGDRHQNNRVKNTPELAEPAPELEPPAARRDALPVARDGSIFSPSVRNGRGHYTVGNKGDERHFLDFMEALEFLRKMPTAKWRRPNAAGNWGIVSAVDWVKPESN
ncbi:ASCH domain-containing protein [Microbulbifer marinus]|uniref:ASCH domain-containing protein n=1 Tax=Microbulbifer marinus TaxID=658218 RepID=A0A1H3WHC2_9GAMM|nr:ASCH domain-containing protein [Microbulbifer marinus]SDZ85732.1 ASCH domain-containing protein [Microbulbifer marinus]